LQYLAAGESNFEGEKNRASHHIRTTGFKKILQHREQFDVKANPLRGLNFKTPAFVEPGKKFFRKRHYILNCFICKITFAVSGGINTKIKRLKRMAHGYRDVTCFLKKTLQHCGL
jgi:transposase